MPSRHAPGACLGDANPQRGRALLWLALCTAGGTALGGCALGSVGTLAAHVQQRDTVSVLSVHAIGLHWRTRADDPGAHFGYSRRSYALAADKTLRPGWYVLNTPSPDGSAFAQDLIGIGIGFSAAAPEPGFSLGYLHTRLLARVPMHASVLIEYAGPDWQIVNLQTCAENAECATPLLPR